MMPVLLPLHPIIERVCSRLPAAVILLFMITLVGCGRIDELEAQVSELEYQVAADGRRIEELEREVEELEERLERVSSALGEADSDLDLVERQSMLLESDTSFYVQSAVRQLRESLDTAIGAAR